MIILAIRKSSDMPPEIAINLQQSKNSSRLLPFSLKVANYRKHDRVLSVGVERSISAFSVSLDDACCCCVRSQFSAAPVGENLSKKHFFSFE